MNNRPVDRAMNEDRPEKVRIRELWLQELLDISRRFPNSDVPWLLTLSGGQGKDIKNLIDAGVIELTEVGSISEKHQDKVVAVENSGQSVLQLQKRFPGLNIKEANFADLVRSTSPFAWPDAKLRPICSARLINLDLNSPFRAIKENSRLIFPVLEWIKKLGEIHLDRGINWTLCLTLHGEIVGDNESNQYLLNFLRDNFKREPYFAHGCEIVFGQELYRLVNGTDEVDLGKMRQADQQRLITVLVPKKIAQLLHGTGWRIETSHNFRYGGGGHAPMTSWVLKFILDPQMAARPEENYREALRGILMRAGEISATGEVNYFPV